MQFRKDTFLKPLAMIAIGGVMLGAQPLHALEYDDPQGGAEVLTRGPVHEAFASAVSYDAEAGIIVSSRPPELIEELPPEQKPVGTNVAWIPGYWGWDEDQSEFLWVSGVWRNLPPGREWVPGYWAEVDTRFQWTSGYWQDAETETVSYLPEPPRSLERGPSVAAPSADMTWVSGNWRWTDNSYAWSAGYWAPARTDWIWTPSCYRWTHRGYVYVDGYWDYAVPRRGVLFAPVRFHSGVYVNPGYHYRPSTVISISVFTNHLFLRPNYCHYYFGDYYAPRYRDRGYYASYSYHSSRRGYDPIYYHNRWEHRHDRNWERERREYFEFRRDNEGSRPPRTWAAWNSRPERERGVMAQRYDRFIGSRRDDGLRFQAVGREDRERIVSQRQEIRRFGSERRDREIRGTRPERGQVARAETRRSPLAGRTASRGADAPPRRLESNRPQQARRDDAGPRTASRPDRPGERRNAGQNPSNPGRENGIARQQNRESANRGNVERPNRETAGRGNANRGSVERPNMNRENGGRETANRGTAARPNAERGNAGRDNASRGNVARPNQDDRNRTASRGNAGQARNNAVAPPVRQVQPERKRENAVSPPVKKQESPRSSAPRAERQGERKAVPQRQAQPQQRKVVPQPQRQYRPKNQAEPKRATPAPRREAPAVRQSPPQRKAQPQRQAQPQQRQASPQRQPQRQAAPQRQAQPKRQAAPQRKPEAQRARPQQQSAPRAQQRPQQQQPRAQQQRAQSRPNQARPAQRSESKKNDRRDARRDTI